MRCVVQHSRLSEFEEFVLVLLYSWCCFCSEDLRYGDVLWSYTQTDGACGAYLGYCGLRAAHHLDVSFPRRLRTLRSTRVQCKIDLPSLLLVLLGFVCLVDGEALVVEVGSLSVLI